jgi:hypothetical protein
MLSWPTDLPDISNFEGLTLTEVVVFLEVSEEEVAEPPHL